MNVEINHINILEIERLSRENGLPLIRYLQDLGTLPKGINCKNCDSLMTVSKIN
jgi:hypothetical protein